MRYLLCRAIDYNGRRLLCLYTPRGSMLCPRRTSCTGEKGVRTTQHNTTHPALASAPDNDGIPPLPFSESRANGTPEKIRGVTALFDFSFRNVESTPSSSWSRSFEDLFRRCIETNGNSVACSNIV
mmetsp:Transcript_27870/g.61391  ORF Transcript_27870/g.61391 Transcript_27870/m.61391 type:complete len:126 (+) Transcript_27870:1948-2325(+)